MEGLTCRANGKRYFLEVLRRAGVGAPHLITFYTVFIRPTPEYAPPVWHPGLTQRLSDDLERVQSLCLHAIHPKLSYSKALAALDLPQLCARRQELCRNFARAAFRSPDFRDWFLAGNFRQARHAYYLRNNNQLSIRKCRTHRLENSRVHYIYTPHQALKHKVIHKAVIADLCLRHPFFSHLSCKQYTSYIVHIYIPCFICTHGRNSAISCERFVFNKPFYYYYYYYYHYYYYYQITTQAREFWTLSHILRHHAKTELQ